MKKTQKFCLLILLVFTFSCKNNSIWIKIKDDVSSNTLTSSDIKARFSSAAISAIVDDEKDTLKQIVSFFNDLSNNGNYKIEKQDTLTYVTFNPDDQLAAGPSIEIKGTFSDWYISDIRFGK